MRKPVALFAILKKTSRTPLETPLETPAEPPASELRPKTPPKLTLFREDNFFCFLIIKHLNKEFSARQIGRADRDASY